MDFIGVDDMIAIDDLNERTLLENVRVRFASDVIYTYTGRCDLRVGRIIVILVRDRCVLAVCLFEPGAHLFVFSVVVKNTILCSILVAVNPYQKLPLYTNKLLQLYASADVDQRSLPPHVFAVASAVYRRLMDTGNNQSVLISGCAFYCLVWWRVCVCARARAYVRVRECSRRAAPRLCLRVVFFSVP